MTVPVPAPVDQVEILAGAMTDRALWDDIYAALTELTADPAEAARQLANHGWCDLFVGLVRVVEECRSVMDKIPEWGKRVVKKSIADSSLQPKRPQITGAVVDVVVDKVWAAFKSVLVAKVPLLSLITHEETLRSLRFLALFSCPAPERHREVREHAVKPLGDDAVGILTERTRKRLAQLFQEWE
ncbi:hypothetical protein HFP15_13940 [Amycolatopsis sp. K13G38]|uniref:Uncharacterized protein n=1 Tax=Amycolatopsis acididurans TaxID=2724524 RepID=A0ABX1J2V1_9PSEU|nr:hypothetical protein [Amycolatopsis acididurans]NKQ53984.1 hypothetical protein [Amycolatopsis acididurans]